MGSLRLQNSPSFLMPINAAACMEGKQQLAFIIVIKGAPEDEVVAASKTPQLSNAHPDDALPAVGRWREAAPATAQPRLHLNLDHDTHKRSRPNSGRSTRFTITDNHKTQTCDAEERLQCTH
jgi:hypothetical protein